MADPWIKMRTTLPRCPQVVRLASAFDADTCPLPVRMLSALGALHVTWSLFDAHSADGLMSGYTLDAIDLAVGVTGWGQAMVDVGWLAVSPCGVTVPEWETHNGTSSKRRLQDMERKRTVRTRSGQTSAPEADAERTPSLSPSKSLSLSPSPSDSPSEEPVKDPTRGIRRAKHSGCTLDEHLAEPEFSALRSDLVEAARAWAGYRRERRPKVPSWGPAQWRPALRDAIRDPGAFLEAVQFSIRQKYQGLIVNGNGRPKAKTFTETAQDTFAAGREAARLMGVDFSTGKKIQ